MDGSARPPFGTTLRRHRLDAGLTQEALAERAGLSTRGIQNLEAGVRRPQPDTLARLTRALRLEGVGLANFERAGRSSPRHSHPGEAGLTADARPRGLSASLASFVGREREVAEVRELLGAHRLVTLTGTGGVGKTRLAVEAAATAVEAFADGLRLVSLATIGDPELVLPTLAQALAVREAPGQTLLETLVRALRGRHLLLVLDNFEHVLGAAPRVGELLAACPRLAVLATSRAPLYLYGEQEYSVPPLTLPDPRQAPSPERLRDCDAVALFVERAKAVRPDFALTYATAPAVAEICRRLDGLPLGIELAAARTRLLPPQALLGRLDSRLRLLTGGPQDAPARQRTMRAAIDWSHDLLEAEERVLFRRLGVFVGGCTLDAAQAVCNVHGGAPADILDSLGSLVDHGLLRTKDDDVGEPRLTMFETIREYASERLVESGEDAALGERHAAYYLGLADRAELPLLGPEHAVWMGRLTSELGNLRAALRWFAERDDAERGLRMAGALRPFWVVGGHLREGRDWLEPALARGGASAPVRARALGAAGHLAWALGDYAVASARFRENLDLYRELGDEWRIAQALLDLGMVARDRGASAESLGALEEGLPYARSTGDRRMVAMFVFQMGMLERQEGALDRAQRHLQDALAISRGLDLTWSTGDVLQNLGLVAEDLGDHERARALYAESLALKRDAGYVAGLPHVLEGLAGVAAAQGRSARALVLAGAAAAMRERTGGHVAPVVQSRVARTLAVARQELGDSDADAAWASGRALTPEQAIAEALDEAEGREEHVGGWLRDASASTRNAR